MKPQHILLLFLLFSISHLSLGQSWERTFFDSTALAKGFDAIQTSDSGYVMVGEVDLPTGAIRHYIWLVKTDNDGNELWSNVYGTWHVANDKGRAIIELSNGDLMIAGTHSSKASVFTTNANGDSLWTEEFGGQGISAFHDIVQDSSGNLILVGELETGFNTGQYEIWAMGMNTDGDSLWSASYFTPSSLGTTAHEISALPSNDFLITGTLGGLGFAMEIAGADGSEVWSNTYLTSSSDRLFTGSLNTEGSRFLIGGMGTGFAICSPILFETTLFGGVSGALLATSVSSGAITSLFPTLDSGFIVTGSSYNFWSQSSDIGFLTKLDANLDIEWEFTYEDSLDQQGASVRQYPDGSIILAGSRKGGMWLKKIMTDSTSTPIDEQVPPTVMKVYPNPADKRISVEIPELTSYNDISISLYDALGRLVEEKPIRNHLTMIDLEYLPRGIYQYTIHDSAMRFGTGKLLLR